MDSAQLADEIRKWLEESGILKEMQTRLRAKMCEKMMEKEKAANNKAPLLQMHPGNCAAAAAVNSLILEHLLR